ncbi:MAG: hypothetical protein CVU99_02515 [Firmicutes bacterium HGW-Firmicutes-4]|jgi:hypothetical protein|nr:MAG: hypothetical protein CVU99_02515 [Firmicutes bacterium HGW-Firmicutes-4]
MTIEPSCLGCKSDEAENTDPCDACKGYGNYEKVNRYDQGEEGGVYIGLDTDRLREAWNELIDAVAKELRLYELLEWLSKKLGGFKK